MSVLKKIFGGGAKALVDSIGGVVDGLHTSQEEKDSAKQKLSELVTIQLNTLYSTQASVIQTEAKGNWIQRSWRPLLMLGFGFIVLNVYFFMPVADIWVDNAELTKFYTEFKDEHDFWGLLKIGIGGYVGGRSLEKVTDSITKNIDITSLKRKDRKNAIK